MVGNHLNLKEKDQNICFNIRPIFTLSTATFGRLDNIFFLKEFHAFIQELRLRQMHKKPLLPFSWEEYLEFSKKMGAAIQEETLEKLLEQLRKESLLFIPHKQHKEFERVRDNLIKNLFGGELAIKEPRELYLLTLYNSVLKQLIKIQDYSNKPQLEALRLLKMYLPKNSNRPQEGNSNYWAFEHGIFLVLKILQDLNYIVEKNGGKFVLADGMQRIGGRDQHLPAKILSSVLKRFSSLNNSGYVDIGECIAQSKKKGIRTSWKFDNHFTSAGNKVFADCLYDWFKPKLANSFK